ncbi:hypothetical protein [Halobaculum magnesiiphilum]|uniref:Uncharacterized protein n=1 Tax=Halobaculum magnesiiphilum TaxID=1017351 RepID=A0A8T8WBE7_9EURY|nr:hypothetical protein [Halobaculum magnesiiphilum]QZP37074.1 hypothetical protein K6T50_12350 [Halobaculum magnesiiphilum]
MSASIDAGIDWFDPRTYLDIGRQLARNAIWAPDPFTQLVTNVVIIVAAMLSSSVGFAPGILIALTALFFIGVAILRLAYGAVM